ncbi:hypothetical protein CKAH01_03290 [Colletotrichum kahawae]|uniref:Uncharacterized protein n=1 Tax=Colletotrichum kahawae TaxID=34407 RepID=A0AAE0DBA4_COLKA|nr:hypothetical protein CKAH01_03290 [Colletotrichum kahawae]
MHGCTLIRNNCCRLVESLSYWAKLLAVGLSLCLSLITHVEQQQTNQPGRPAARTGQDLLSSLHALLPPRRSLPCCGRHLETSPAAAVAKRTASSLTSSAQLSPAPDQPARV